LQEGTPCPLLAHSRHGLLHCTCPLSGAKRTWPIAVHMSGFDPKQTSAAASNLSIRTCKMPCPGPRADNETARIHPSAYGLGRRLAACRGCATVGNTGYRLSRADLRQSRRLFTGSIPQSIERGGLRGRPQWRYWKWVLETGGAWA